MDKVQRLVGVKMGKQIHDYENGNDDSPVLAAPEEAKGYSISTTLERDVVTTEQAHKVLLALTDRVTARMRADGVIAYCVAVSIRSNDFKTRSHQKKLLDPTDISTEVYKLRKQLFAELWDAPPLRTVWEIIQRSPHLINARNPSFVKNAQMTRFIFCKQLCV